MQQTSKIKDIIRQEEVIEKEIKRLSKQRMTLEQKKQRLFCQRKLLALREFVGQTVVMDADVREDNLIPLRHQTGKLLKVHRNEECDVDFGDLGIHRVSTWCIVPTAIDDWRLVFRGK